MTCTDHPDNEGTCIHCLNDVVQQRDDRERAWHQAERDCRHLAQLLNDCQAEAWRMHQLHADAERAAGRPTPDTDVKWLTLSAQIDHALDTKLPPSIDPHVGRSALSLKPIIREEAVP